MRPGSLPESWDDLRFFLQLVRRGTLAEAGHALGVDPSTVFRRLRSLEESVGERLLRREGRGYALTPLGEVLGEHAEKVEEAVHAAERSVTGSGAGLRGVLRLTTSDSLAEHLLPSLLPGFRREHPEIELEILAGSRPYRLARGEADLALRPGDEPTSEADVVAVAVASIPGAFYAAQSYLKRAGRPKRRSELARHEIVDVDVSLEHTRYARISAKRLAGATVVLRSTSLPVQAASVEAGLGVGALPCFLMAGRPGVVRLFAPDPELATPLWLLFHRDLRRAARVRAFADYLIRELPSQPGLEPIQPERTRRGKD